MEDEGGVGVELEAASEIGSGGDDEFATAGGRDGVEGVLECGGVFGFAVGDGVEVAGVEGGEGRAGDGHGGAGNERNQEGGGKEDGGTWVHNFCLGCKGVNGGALRGCATGKMVVVWRGSCNW